MTNYGSEETDKWELIRQEGKAQADLWNPCLLRETIKKQAIEIDRLEAENAQLRAFTKPDGLIAVKPVVRENLITEKEGE